MLSACWEFGQMLLTLNQEIDRKLPKGCLKMQCDRMNHGKKEKEYVKEKVTSSTSKKKRDKRKVF